MFGWFSADAVRASRSNRFSPSVPEASFLAEHFDRDFASELEVLRAVNLTLYACESVNGDECELLEKWFKQQRSADEPYTDAAIRASFPGVGAFVLPSVLSYAHDPVRLRNLEAFRSLSGIAPVTQKSGKRGQKKPKILMRRARSLPLNNALHHWARVAVLQDHTFKEHYHRLRARGHSHARTLRGVMDRILTIAVAMLRDRTLYDPARRSPRKQLDSS